jgi:protocadherin Fat 4
MPIHLCRLTLCYLVLLQVQHYIFVVQAQDSGRPSLSSTLTVYFNVVDLNDNAPLFDPMSYSNEVFENVTVGTSVVTVSATDLDSGSLSSSRIH